jgi:hypothetical protein
MGALISMREFWAASFLQMTEVFRNVEARQNPDPRRLLLPGFNLVLEGFQNGSNSEHHY